MRLSELLAIFPEIKWGEFAGHSESEVSEICFDSRRLAANCVFVAVKGSKFDGHDFLDAAAASGALALLVQNLARVPVDFKGAVVCVENTRLALNMLAAQYFGHASRELFCAGVTGTNGKTTLTHMIEEIFNFASKPTGVIGTIDHHLKGPKGFHQWKSELTTPGPIDFQSRLREFKDLGAVALALEISNVGLLQNRADEVEFDVAVFTNLSRDHLDVHPDMEHYFAIKRRLFKDLLMVSRKPRPTAVINVDDEYGRRLLAELREKQKIAEGRKLAVWGYGREGSGQHDLSFRVVSQGFSGTRFVLQSPKGAQEVEILMPGLHNVYNAVGAIGAALVAGISLRTCAASLRGLTGVKGRLEAVPNLRGLHVFVDYAHTDDALVSVLHCLGRLRDEAGLRNKLITVFGCGGDRDKGKRPLMMKVAAQGSDLVVVTSDNPRTENPESIISDALSGANPSDLGRRVFSVVDRREGIRKGLSLASEGDVLVIAGKGHENYQIIGTVRQPFSDVEVVKELLG
jgi:UDP-N-acetylmuramoyl-L-alanyl-D-glutamate--2,6-diaminopimelate ligase